MSNPLKNQAAVYEDPGTLVPWDRNPRINDHAVEAVAESIRRLGFGAPVLAQNGTRRIISGHTRLKASLKLGLKEIPVRFLDVSNDVAEKLALADNKLNEAAEWDAEVLAALALEYDLTELGWDQGEVDELTADLDEGFWDMGDDSKQKRNDGPLTLKIHCSETGDVERALSKAMQEGSATRGDAIVAICAEYLKAQAEATS